MKDQKGRWNICAFSWQDRRVQCCNPVNMNVINTQLNGSLVQTQREFINISFSDQITLESNICWLRWLKVILEHCRKEVCCYKGINVNCFLMRKETLSKTVTFVSRNNSEPQDNVVNNDRRRWMQVLELTTCCQVWKCLRRAPVSLSASPPPRSPGFLITSSSK